MDASIREEQEVGDGTSTLGVKWSPLTLTRYVILDCEGKPLSGGGMPWLYASEHYAGSISEHFARSKVQRVKVLIEKVGEPLIDEVPK